MEPTPATAPELAEIVAELSRREPIFHRTEFGTSRADFDKLMVEDYWETGASGRRYTRPFILDLLESRYAAPQNDVWETSGFHCRKLAEDVYLLTYTLLQNSTQESTQELARLTRRATIWQRTPEGWKIVYHQGTIVQEA
jgi:hypothetical protein